MRKFKLPGVQDLTKHQEMALGYPDQGQHLVIGGPGTGKTVVMVMRAIDLQRNGGNYVFLVYNHMLHQASQQMAGEWIESSTWVSWFYKLFYSLTGEYVPEVRSYSPNWGECVRRIEKDRNLLSKVKQRGRNKILLIDEGQDMPPGFYWTLTRFGYENFFIAADQNQQINVDENSSRRDLEDALALDTSDVIELRRNFRNNYAVARLARAFYTGDRASPPPKLPKPKGQLHVPKLYVFKDRKGVKKSISKAIIKLFQQDNRRLIGVFAPNERLRQKYLDKLEKICNSLSGNSPKIYTYSHGMQPNVQFNRGGIVVLNAQSCKGLEFDIVVLVDINGHYVLRENTDEIRKLFYVMVSRARDQVFMIIKDGPNSIQNILPKDQNVLQWDRKTFG